MEQRGALWAVAVPLIAFKLCVAVLLLSHAPNGNTWTWIAATHWPLLLVIGLLVGPGIATWRLLRARAHRDRLRREEWMTPSVSAVEPAAPLASGPQWSLWDTVSRLERDD